MPRRGIDLTEEEWRRVKAAAASRGQTISEYIGYVIEAIAGPVTPAGEPRVSPKREAIHVEPTGPADATGRTPVRPFTPVPKPGGKKR